MTKTGKVYLVGAGPGDVGLLTTKGREMLQKAQVVVYDRLVSRDILELIPEEAIRIDVGKYAGRHPVPQERINEILREQALAGRQVVRLKGGDCFLFGRGGEELELLWESGVPFEVVPGIPSALAAPAYGGIPVTHRDFCSSVHIITGHKKEDGELSLDYDALIRLQGTLIFMMSVASGAEIAKGLMTHGMAVSMPCAVVENGTRSEQRTFVTTLQHLEGIIQKERIQSPALIVVGPVCTLAEKFDWFSKLPLKGARLLVTRPKEKEGTLVGRLRELGAHVTSLPAIATKPVPFPIPDLSQYGVLVFTSGAGVNSFFQALWREGLDARKMAGLKIAVVGKETEKQLATYGLRADFVPTVFCAETLAGEMLESGFLEKGIRVLLIQAKIASEEVFQRLSARGIQTDRLTVYETQYVQQEGIDPGEYDFGIFTSASSVEGYARALGGKAEVEALAAVYLGAQTAAAARERGMPVYVAKEATIQSLIETVWEQYRDKKKENEG